MSADRDGRDTADAPPPEEPPPVLGSWRRLYAVVLGELALVVALLYALTRWAS